MEYKSFITEKPRAGDIVVIINYYDDDDSEWFAISRFEWIDGCDIYTSRDFFYDGRFFPNLGNFGNVSDFLWRPATESDIVKTMNIKN